MKTPQAVFREFLGRKRLKTTPQRMLILEVFLGEGGHLATEDLYHKVKGVDRTIGQATVYRTLKLLSESGLAKEVHFGDGVTRYEHHYGQEHHDHLICDQCGLSIEVVDERIEKLQDELARRQGFLLTGHRLYLYGVCPECRKVK